MPRNVRPSWIEVDVDDVRRAATGPKARTGRLDVTLSVRKCGSVVKALDVSAVASADGKTVTVQVRDLSNTSAGPRVVFDMAYLQ